MQEMSYYSYEAYDQENVKKVRIPQQEWKDGVPELGAGGLPVVEGKVLWFKFREGYGMIDTEEGEVFFNFTAIPGEGYRTIKPGTRIKFEQQSTNRGMVARNIQIVEKSP